MDELIDLMSTSKPEVDARTLERRLLDQLQISDPNKCFECAKCTSGCPAMKLLELHPHEVMGLVNLGFIDELIKSDVIWCCVTCLKCQERCPQRVSPVEAILALRTLAVAKGMPIPEGFSTMLTAILEKGYFQDPQEMMTRDAESGKKGFTDRKDLGLSDHKGPEDKDKFKAMLMAALTQSI
ncbi:MAG: 4Fe-4S dicluster domain-containing protein [Thermoplasmata archaeon]|nr:MAG: 4Fe-4S dicluster domain-containing protein [Thermoplasmata archaeon]